jgi:hypothetical protein
LIFAGDLSLATHARSSYSPVVKSLPASAGKIIHSRVAGWVMPDRAPVREALLLPRGLVEEIVARMRLARENEGMAYRGEDLDLRTPQARLPRESYSREESSNGLNGGWRRRERATSRSEPLYVDEAVLSCCNHAYDVAHAHGAGAVRLEHLIHALTRVEAAVEVLEQRGIREAQLRRESAAVIASDIPVGLAHRQGMPRATMEFEDVLRRAVEHAAARNSVATVNDLLWVLFNYDRDNPAIALLLRHAPDWQRWEWPHRREDYGRHDEARREPRHSYYGESYTERPLAYAEPETLPRPRIEPADNEQRAERFDKLEASIKGLQADITNDQRALVDLIRELQRDVSADRADASAPPTALIDRLKSIEAAVESRFGDLDRSAMVLNERLEAMEKVVAGGLAEGARHSAAIGERIAAFEGGPGAEVRAISQLLQAVGERQHALEQSMSVQRADIAQLKASLGADLRPLVERALVNQSQSGPALQALVSEKLHALTSGLEAQTANIASSLSSPLLEGFRQLNDRLASLDSVMKTQDQRAHELTALRERDFADLRETLVKLGSHLQTLADSLERWRLESGGDLSIISNRLELLERSAKKPVEAVERLSAEVATLERIANTKNERQRGSFKHWLFGTDDVLATGWRGAGPPVKETFRKLRGSRTA